MGKNMRPSSALGAVVLVVFAATGAVSVAASPEIDPGSIYVPTPKGANETLDDAPPQDLPSNVGMDMVTTGGGDRQRKRETFPGKQLRNGIYR